MCHAVYRSFKLSTLRSLKGRKIFVFQLKKIYRMILKRSSRILRALQYEKEFTVRVYLLLTLLLVTNNVSASFITQHFSVQDLDITKQGDYFDNVIQANTTLNLLFSLTTDLTARYTDSSTQVDYWDSNSRYRSTTTNVGSNQISLNSESTLLDSILSIQSEADEIQEIASITESFFDTVAPGSLDMIDSLMSVQRSYNSIQDIQYKGSVESGNYSETRFILSSWVGVRSSQTVHQIDAQMPSMASPASQA